MKKAFLVKIVDGKEPTYRIYKTLDTHYIELVTDVRYLNSTLEELCQINKNFFNNVSYLKVLFYREYYLCNINYNKILKYIQSYINDSCNVVYNVLEDV